MANVQNSVETFFGVLRLRGYPETISVKYSVVVDMYC